MSAAPLRYRVAASRAFVAAAASLALAGCSGSDGYSFGPLGPGRETNGSDAGATGDDGGDPNVVRVYDVTTGAVTLAPGEERVVCVDRRLPNDESIDVSRITSEITEGGHHLVFYKSNETVEKTTPVECTSFRGVFNGTVPLFIAQKQRTALNFPPGIAYTLPAGQMVRIELHFLNATDKPRDVSGTVHVGAARPGTVVERANLLFYGNLNIRIPPQSTTTVGPTFRSFRTASPHIFGLTGHQHKRGTGVTIELGSSRTGAGTMLYENHDWAEPPLTIFDPPIATSPGQGFRYSCTYFNPTNQFIGFGEGVNQEMCFLWAYYYPDMGLEVGIDF